SAEGSLLHRVETGVATREHETCRYRCFLLATTGRFRNGTPRGRTDKGLESRCAAAATFLVEDREWTLSYCCACVTYSCLEKPTFCAFRFRTFITRGIPSNGRERNPSFCRVSDEAKPARAH